MMKPNEITAVYTTGETTPKAVIPVYLEAYVAHTVDVTNLSTHERQLVKQAITGYNEYRELQLKKIFTFSDWLTHTVDPVELPRLIDALENTEPLLIDL